MKKFILGTLIISSTLLASSYECKWEGKVRGSIDVGGKQTITGASSSSEAEAYLRKALRNEGYYVKSVRCR